MTEIFDCIIVGAGLAGLTAGKKLQENGWTVVIFEKAREVGGRMATCSVQNARCDHGAQFFTVRSQDFAAIVSTLKEQNCVTKWCHGFYGTTKQGDLINKEDNYPRYRGISGMTDYPKFLAQKQTVYLQQQVKKIYIENNLWCLKTDNMELRGRSLLLTPPAPQSLELIESDNYTLPIEVKVDLQKIVYDPCFAVVATLESATQIPAPGAIEFTTGSIYWLADNYQKGISKQYSITIHASGDFTRENWDREFTEVAEILLKEVAPFISPVTHFEVHRWHYSRPTVVHPEPCLVATKSPPLVFAGDAFAGPKVEGAVLSGLRAAETFLTIFDSAPG